MKNQELRKIFTWYDFAKYLVKGILICIFLLTIMWIVSSCTTTKQIVSADNLVSERFTVESDTQSGIYNDPDYGLIYFSIPSDVDWNKLLKDWYDNNLEEYIIINNVLLYKNSSYYECLY